MKALLGLVILLVLLAVAAVLARWVLSAVAGRRDDRARALQAENDALRAAVGAAHAALDATRSYIPGLPAEVVVPIDDARRILRAARDGRTPKEIRTW